MARRTADLEKANQQIRASLGEKEVMLKEIHHRVKNNLQVISSLLRMQARLSNAAEVTSILTESQNRIRSMALIHDLLYQSKDLRSIHFKKYLETLLAQLHQSYDPNHQIMDFLVEGTELELDLDTAIPCGLIVTELVSNACKHAFPNNRKGTVRVRLEPEGDNAILTIEDNGKGLSSAINFDNPASVGFSVVGALTRQMDGTLETHSTMGEGTCFTLKIPYRTDQPLAAVPVS